MLPMTAEVNSLFRGEITKPHYERHYLILRVLRVCFFAKIAINSALPLFFIAETVSCFASLDMNN